MDAAAARGSLLDRLLGALPICAERAQQLGGLFQEARSFGLIGAINAVADIVFFTALHAGLSVGPLSSKVVSGVITIIASYYANRGWTWLHRPGQAHQRRQLLHFGAISGAGLALAEGCLGLSHYVLRLPSVLADNISANGVGLALGMVWRFYASRRWVFTADEPATIKSATSAAKQEHSTSTREGAAPHEAIGNERGTDRSMPRTVPRTMPMPRISLDQLLTAGDPTSGDLTSGRRR